jgi:hypothetical protein
MGMVTGSTLLVLYHPKVMAWVGVMAVAIGYARIYILIGDYLQKQYLDHNGRPPGAIP